MKTKSNNYFLKKEREALMFGRFCSRYFTEPVSFDQPDSPLPDVLFQIGEKKIGVEITEIKSDSQPKKGSMRANMENNIRLINNSIGERMKKVQQKGLIVKVYYDFNWKFEKAIRDEKAQIYFDKIKNLVDSLGKKPSYTSPDDEELPAGIMGIRIYRNNDLISCCDPVLAHWAPEIEAAHLQRYIDYKTSMKSKYEAVIDEAWLLLVSNFEMSSDFDIYDLNAIDTSGWEKAIIFNHRTGKIVWEK